MTVVGFGVFVQGIVIKQNGFGIFSLNNERRIEGELKVWFICITD